MKKYEQNLGTNRSENSGKEAKSDLDPNIIKHFVCPDWLHFDACIRGIQGLKMGYPIHLFR